MEREQPMEDVHHEGHEAHEGGNLSPQRAQRAQRKHLGKNINRTIQPILSAIPLCSLCSLWLKIFIHDSKIVARALRRGAHRGKDDRPEPK